MSAPYAGKPLHVCIDSAYTYTVWTSDGDEPIATCKSLETAHLLAAAPDLLEALRSVLDEWEFKRATEGNRNKDVTPQWVYDARAALAMAAVPSDLPGHEKPKHWFYANRDGFSTGQENA